jgi:hypothetical protein
MSKTAAEKQEKSPEVQKLEADVKAISEPKPASIRAINQTRVQLGQSARNVWRAVVPLEDTLEQIMSPMYWINLQRMLRPLDRIEIIPDDRRFFAELLVLSVQMHYIPVALLSHVDLPHVEMQDIPSEYKVEYAGPYELFRVLRSNKVVVSKLQSADQAKRWLRDHLKAQQL